jgi:hypothetical protein
MPLMSQLIGVAAVDIRFLFYGAHGAAKIFKKLFADDAWTRNYSRRIHEIVERVRIPISTFGMHLSGYDGVALRFLGPFARLTNLL